MSDLALVMVQADDAAPPFFDIDLSGGDFALDDGLLSSVWVSIFADARAAPDALPMGETDPRGFWADTFAPDGDNTGSLLWLHWRQKNTPLVRQAIADAVRDSLQWMIDDGVAVSVEVSATWVTVDIAGFAVVITRPSGEKFDVEWRATIGDD